MRIKWPNDFHVEGVEQSELSFLLLLILCIHATINAQRFRYGILYMRGNDDVRECMIDRACAAWNTLCKFWKMKS